jgi:hypothetical protein
VSAAWEVALWLVILWLGGLLFQIADLGTAWFDLRNARTSAGQLARRRAHELFWVAPTAALLALALAFGIDLAASLVFDRDVLVVVGILLALAVIVLVVSVTMVATVTLLTTDIHSYALLRFAIGDAQARKLTKAEVDVWRTELKAIDDREAVRHERIARALRLIPIGLSVLALAAVWVAVIDGMQQAGADLAPMLLGIAAALIPVASIVLAIRSARLSLRARASWALVNGKQRAELVKTLDELERRTSRGVAGLSDRVNRALQILRDQQL